METQLPTPARLRSSVIAVPPLARDSQLRLAAEPNRKLIRYLEQAGVSHLLYGGNAVLYHIPLSEYGQMLGLLADTAAAKTLICPSAGPTYGLLMDHAEVLKDFDFPTVMVLPQRDIADAAGIARGIRLFAERLGRPVVVYLKFDRWLPVDSVRRLFDDGVVSWIKYAVVRDDPSDDRYLRELIDQVPAERIVSGIGEQPAIIHTRDFGLAGYTSGCVCVAPRRSMEMLGRMAVQEYSAAEAIREKFVELEDLRNGINPIRVLHRAVELAGIAETGPILPLLGEVPAGDVSRVGEAAKRLLKWEQQASLQLG
jgi:dihydrodipicolinate synthase/N-acetylneuraminate lyase